MPEDYIQISVPQRWASAIYARLAELAQDDATFGLAANAVPTPPPEITGPLVDRIWNESDAPLKEFMRFLARHPDSWFSTPELAQELGHENGARGVSGMLGAYGRRAKHRYGSAKPWDTRWNTKTDKAVHRMPAAHATLVLEAADRERPAERSERDAPN